MSDADTDNDMYKFLLKNENDLILYRKAFKTTMTCGQFSSKAMKIRTKSEIKM